jgi:FKBP-type peptidyl-prolyl cis-trans isomerase
VPQIQALMKNVWIPTLSFVLLAAGVFSCEKNRTDSPKIGDFVFYDYEVRQGAALVFSAATTPGDTAEAFVEDPERLADTPYQEALMKQLLRMAPGDSSRFAIGKDQEGFLRLHRFVAQEDYPKYIAEGDRRRAVFEERLEEIKAEMASKNEGYAARATQVADSTARYAELLRAGELDGSLQPLASGIRYLLIEEGSGITANKSSSWTWVHFCSVLPDGQPVLNTYSEKPVVVNRRGALLGPWLEIVVTRLPEGSRALLVVPPDLALEAGIKGTAGASDLLVLMEIARVNNM